MSESEVLQIMREYYSGLFPKTCPSCERSFGTLRDYVTLTKPVGRYISYDVDGGNWTPDMGTFALANCPCGDTLALTTSGLPQATRVMLLEWIRSEAERRAMAPADLLQYLRSELRRQLLAEPAP